MQLQNSIELYKLMAQRHKDSGFAPHQHKVYTQLAEVISNCQTIDEASTKLQSPPYVTMPSVALIQDKLEAWIKAAKVNGMDDVAAVYQDKLNNIQNNPNEIHNPAYETQAQTLKSNYILTMQAFAGIFNSYITYIVNGQENYLDEIKRNLACLVAPTNDFVTLSKLQQFRDLIPLNKIGYAKFVEDISNFYTSGQKPQAIQMQKETENNFSFGIFKRKKTNTAEGADEQFNNVVKHKKEILERGKVVLENTKSSKVVAQAPDVPDDISFDDEDTLKYSYSDEEVE